MMVCRDLRSTITGTLSSGEFGSAFADPANRPSNLQRCVEVAAVTGNWSSR